VRKKVLILLLFGVMLLGVPALAAAQGSGDMIQDQTRLQDPIQDQTQDQIKDQTQDQTQDQIKDQNQTQLLDQDQTRLRLRDRLHITDDAKVQMQDRLQLQEQFNFSDMQQHWAREQVREAYLWGLASGYPDGSYKPESNITGTEAVLMMSRLANCIAGIDPGTGTAGDIDWNVVPLWARERMQESTALRIASQSQFYGEQQQNRLQFTVMLAKSLGIEQATVPEGTMVFQDQSGIPAGDLGYVLALKNMRIVAGDNGSFYPERLVTRAEAAVLLVKTINVLE
jgi:hypothetical protein